MKTTFFACCLCALAQLFAVAVAQPPKVIPPLLSGFNPDPTICRVGKDYYLATSSFELLPGIPIYHSTDLRNWTVVSHAWTKKLPCKNDDYAIVPLAEARKSLMDMPNCFLKRFLRYVGFL